MREGEKKESRKAWKNKNFLREIFSKHRFQAAYETDLADRYNQTIPEFKKNLVSIMNERKKLNFL